MSLLIDNISKRFGKTQAVDKLSFEVQEGEILGFLGPNGAGKTTTIRMILDIFRPDTGHITWRGVPVTKVPRSAWGYLPEERGLYPKMTVQDQLIFFARLYGANKATAQREVDYWLERFQITVNRHKKVEELSKGNQQKIQFLATILHDPQVLMMDEPFSGLDPVNAELLKDGFLEMNRRGKTIIFSTHQMSQVEELCKNVLIINKGTEVIKGSVRDVRASTGRTVVRLALENDPDLRWLDDVPGVTVTRSGQDYHEMHLTNGVSPDQILQVALRRDNKLLHFEIAQPSLNEVFIEKLSGVATPDSVVPPVVSPVPVQAQG